MATNAPATRRSGTPALTGTLAAVGAGAMAMTAVCAAYLSVRNATSSGFVPDAMPFNNYVAVNITLTLGLAAAAAGWAATASRTGNRRWGAAGFLLAGFLDLAGLNLIWFLGKGTGLAVADSPYAVLVYGLLGVVGIAVVAATASVVTGAARTLGGHVSEEHPQLARSAAWGQHLATAAWVAAFALIYLYK